MATIVQNTASGTFRGKQATIVKHIETMEFGPEPETIDGLIRHRAKLLGNTPLVYYPHSGIEYVGYSIRQLDLFAYRVAKRLSSRLPARTSSSQKPIVVSFLGPSDLNYLVTFWALAKLGHSVLFLSTRISMEAYASLLERTESKCIVIDKEYQDIAYDLGKRISDLQVDYIAQEDWYNFVIDHEEEIDTNLTPTLDPAQEAKYVSWIIHSSGSTGLPKPIFQTQKAAIKNCAQNMNMRGFITVPLYHNYGMSCLFRSIHSCKSIHLYNTALPLARKYLLGTMNSNDFEVFYGVPYALKLLAETEEGIQALTKFKVVMFSGSPCPDSLGDKLVANGVHLVSQYGSTETGQLMTSARPREDKLWDYLRPSEAVKPFLRFEERSPGLYESVVLDGWPSKVMSNRPDGSYATKDLFTKHPDFEGYKYCARLDDTIVLVNGEKVIPLALEGSVRQDPAVAEVVVFGAQRASIGMLVILTEDGAALSRDELIGQIWPRVEEAQSEMPAFGQLSRDMVVLLPPGTQYPRTDKGTVIRQAVYRTFADVIESTYNDQARGELLALTEPELKEFLQEQLQSILPSKARSLLNENADFFNIGMDSLQTTQLRSIIIRRIDTNGKELGLNVAFDHPSINLLAKYLVSLRSGVSDNHQSVEDTMKALIEKYSVFQRHKPVPNGLDGRYVVVTGASGSLGSHTAAKLAVQPDTSLIYCLIRAGSVVEAYERLIMSLRERRLYDNLSNTARTKLVALPVKLSEPKLGFDESMYNMITSQITDLIHCAWSVNFNWRLPSFEKDNIAGVKNLIDLCLRSQRPTPSSFNFCSSVSTVVNTSEDEIAESLPKSLSYAQDMGYAHSKLVAENICLKAAEQTGLRARVLRIGQVVGDTQHGIWNTTEAIPLMIQSAKTIGALPRLDETHRWLPVDIVAESIVEHSFSTYTSGVLNVINHNSFHWTRDLIPLLRQANLKFEEIETGQWLEKLRASNPDPIVNPPIKLVEFWMTKYGSVEGPKKSFVWHTEKARRYSKALDETTGLSRDDVTRMLHYFRTVW